MSEDVHRGYMEIRVKIAGITQRKKFVISEVQHPLGRLKCLIADDRIAAVELLKIASEHNIPVKTSSTLVFPSGKSPHDFLIKS